MCALRPPFNGQNLHQLAIQIVAGQYQDLPAGRFSQGMQKLIRQLLEVDPKKRPSINRVLGFPILKERVRRLIDNDTFAQEFSHTALHQQNIFDRAQKVLEQDIVEQEDFQKKQAPVEQDIEPIVGQANAVMKQLEQLDVGDQRRKGGEIVMMGADVPPAKKRHGAFQHDSRQIVGGGGVNMQVTGEKTLGNQATNYNSQTKKATASASTKKQTKDHKEEYAQLKEKKKLDLEKKRNDIIKNQIKRAEADDKTRAEKKRRVANQKERLQQKRQEALAERNEERERQRQEFFKNRKQQLAKQ